MWAAMITFAMFGLHCVWTSEIADNFTTCNFDSNCRCLECNSLKSEEDKSCEDDANKMMIVNCHGSADLAHFSGINKSNILSLTLNNCDLEHITADSFSNCPPIAILQFINCPNLTFIESGAFAGHEQHLESLDFSHCNLQNFPMKVFENFTKLTTLRIVKNRVPIQYAGAQIPHESEIHITAIHNNSEAELHVSSIANNTAATPTKVPPVIVSNSISVIHNDTTAIVEACLNGTCNDQSETRTVAFENSTSSQNESESKHGSVSILIAVIVVAVVFVLLTAAIIYCMWQRRYAILRYI